MELWSVGVLRLVGIEPRGRGVGSAFPPSSPLPRNYGGQARARLILALSPGPKAFGPGL
jgi:hypothetical protein